jgi:hypothetical protein
MNCKSHGEYQLLDFHYGYGTKLKVILLRQISLHYPGLFQIIVFLLMLPDTRFSWYYLRNQDLYFIVRKVN